MKGRVVAAALVAAVVAPSAALAYPDWRAPAAVGTAQEGVFRFPQTVAYDASGVHDPDPQAPPGPYVYAADQYSFHVQKYTVDGRFVRRFGGYGSEPGHFGGTAALGTATSSVVGGISGLAVDAQGRVYVLDSNNSRVERFSPAGEFQTQFGEFGAAPGQFDLGIGGGLALQGDELYVADNDNNRVQRFHLGPDGRPDRPPVIFGSSGAGPAQFAFVQGLGVDPAREHDVLVADDDNHRMQRFSAGGAFGAIFGAGQVKNPYDAGADMAGRVFVADNQS